MYFLVKRGLDIFFAFILLGLLIIPMALIGIWIKVDSKGPIFFKQKRIGKQKKHFYIYKFRTMKIDAPENTATHLLIEANTYITKVGVFLRKSSIDEIPQLINIIRGDMSFVGPRPALWNQYDLIVARDTYHVHKLRPGITGWAQVNGRDELSIKKKAVYDGVYIKKVSFLFDLKCVYLTFFSVLKREGIKEGV